jgi:CubicO group peptidase (beta-lactamase class C family)
MVTRCATGSSARAVRRESVGPVTGPAPVGGRCDPRFEAVRAAFERNFAEHGELGAGVTVYLDGRPVVDLHGGWTDATRGREWRPDTLVNVYSVGKGVATVAALHCVHSGLIDVDSPVAAYWPGFGQAGKERITLRQVLSHRSGVVAIRAPMPDATARDWPRMVAALEAQQPWWEPGTAHGYHVNMFGFLVDQTVRAATGRTISALLAEHVTGPLGADAHLGLPAAELYRVADVEDAPTVPTLTDAQRGALPERQLMVMHAYHNPSDLSGVAGVVNTAQWRGAQLASANMHATAHAIARIYAALAAGGTLDGHRIADAGLLAEATVEHSCGHDRVLDRPSRFALGFQLTQPERPLGPNPGAFGHFGAGGALGFADPDAGIGFGYVLNGFGQRWQNPRNRGLIDALYSCL